MVRRPVAVAAALLVAAPVASTAPAHALTGPGPRHAPLTGVAEAAPSSAARTAQQRQATPVRGWDVELGHAATTRRGELVRTARTFETLGVSWERGGDPAVEVRYRSNGVWSDWEDAHPLLGGGGKATEPLWAGPSRTVRVRVDTARPGLALVLVDPGYQPSDEPAAFRQSGTTGSGTASGTTATAALTTSTARTVTTAAAGPGVPMPNIRRRAEWGANPNWRGTDPVYSKTIRQAHVHHTAGSNRYGRADVPGIIRGMYWYHTHQLGWSDIGYNFLVDKFGKIWAGRAGGVMQPVRGAHTLGFNRNTVGVAAIGDYEKAVAGSKLTGALSRLTAWKLDLHRRDAVGRVRMLSEGSDRYPAGTWVRLPVIDGHRDTNETACPGANLYAKLPVVRQRAQQRIDTYR